MSSRLDLVFLFCICTVLFCQNSLAFSPKVQDVNILHRVSLEGYSKAVTNNGNPGVYYLQSTKIDSKKALIYMRGGGYCIPNGVGACSKRCKNNPELCAAKNETYIDIRENSKYKTIWSPDPEVNPAFYNFNKVYVPYSSSDVYTGTRDASPETENLSFHGKYIFEAIIQSLIEMEGSWIKDAEQVVLMGGSAGAFGTEFNCDKMADMLHEVNENVDVRCISDSGTLYPVNVHTEGCDPTEHWVRADEAWKSISDETCEAQAADKEECGLMNTAYRYLDNKMMILMSAEDTTIRHCWVDDPEFRLAWRSELSAIARLIIEDRPDIGVYMANCPYHTQTSNLAAWNDMQIPVVGGEADETILLRDILYNFVNDAGPIHAIDNMEECNQGCNHMNLCG